MTGRPSNVSVLRTKPLDGAGYFVRDWQLWLQDVAGLAARIDDAETRLAFVAGTPLGAVAPVYLTDTHANRVANYPPGNYPAGSLFFESDRTLWFWNTGAAWKFVSGTYAAALAALPGGLGTDDTNLLFRATDYLHTWRWSGAAWGFDGGDASGYLVAVPVAATPPMGGLWQLCDGSSVLVAQPGATTALVTTPNLTTAPFLRGAWATLVANDLLTLAGAGTANSIGLDWYMRR